MKTNLMKANFFFSDEITDDHDDVEIRTKCFDVNILLREIFQAISSPIND